MKKLPKNWKYKRVFDKKAVNSKKFNWPAHKQLGVYSYGLVALKSSFFTYEQLFTIFKILKKYFKKQAKIKFNISCVMPFTKKPISARMGSGKGAWKGCNILVQKGTIILELSNVDKLEALIAFKECIVRSPVCLKLVKIKL